VASEFPGHDLVDRRARQDRPRAAVGAKAGVFFLLKRRVHFSCYSHIDKIIFVCSITVRESTYIKKYIFVATGKLFKE